MARQDSGYQFLVRGYRGGKEVRGCVGWNGPVDEALAVIEAEEGRVGHQVLVERGSNADYFHRQANGGGVHHARNSDDLALKVRKVTRPRRFGPAGGLASVAVDTAIATGFLVAAGAYATYKELRR